MRNIDRPMPMIDPAARNIVPPHSPPNIRDPASGHQLAFDPVPDESADHVVGALAALFILIGAPPVIEAGNVSPFIDRAACRPLAQWGGFCSCCRCAGRNTMDRVRVAARRTLAIPCSIGGRRGEWTCQDTSIARRPERY